MLSPRKSDNHFKGNPMIQMTPEISRCRQEGFPGFSRIEIHHWYLLWVSATEGQIPLAAPLLIVVLVVLLYCLTNVAANPQLGFVCFFRGICRKVQFSNPASCVPPHFFRDLQDIFVPADISRNTKLPMPQDTKKSTTLVKWIMASDLWADQFTDGNPSRLHRVQHHVTLSLRLGMSWNNHE